MTTAVRGTKSNVASRKYAAIDVFGFLPLSESDGDTAGACEGAAAAATPSVAFSLSTTWTDDALRTEESWWASDFLLYLSWKSAWCTSAGLALESSLDHRSSTKPDTSPAVSAAAPVTASSSGTSSNAQSEKEKEEMGDAGSSCSPAMPSPPPHQRGPPPSPSPSHTAETDAALMEQWFKGRWEARLEHYGGCPHMSLRALLWGFFSGAWQQTAHEQALEVAQYATMSAEPSLAMPLAAATPGYAASLEAIDRDVGRTFPHHILFHGDFALSTGQRQLRRLLRAYAARDPEVGYCQGMAFVAAVVLLVAPEPQAYQIFCALMRDSNCATRGANLGCGRHSMRQLYRAGFPLLQTLLAELESHVKSLLPALSAHLQTHDVHISTFASRWFLTLFVHQLPPPLLLRVWDFFLVRGWSVMVQVAVALLHQEQGALLKLDMEGILLHLKMARSRRQNEGELLRCVCNVPLV